MTLGDFSKQAETYGKARPTYPPAMIDLLLADAGVAAGDAVVDFGAGTGIFTRLLVERGLNVTAIEPNEAMRANQDVPQARWVSGTFEASGLETASQKWAVAAQAFHWADPTRALPEIRRILRPGGILSVLWNNRANRENDILDWTENAIRRIVPDFDEAYRDRPWGRILESTGDFRLVSERTVPHVVSMSRERYLQLWRSHNRLTSIAGPERFTQLLGEIEVHLNQLRIEMVNVPYRCEAWSARAV